MKKSDIKNGMHVITKGGEEYVIVSVSAVYPSQIEKAHTIMANIDGGWMNFDKYTNDLRCESGNSDYDIKAVFEPKYYSATLMSVRSNYDYDKYNFIKLWERPTVKKMTKAEIEAELGYEIEIVED